MVDAAEKYAFEECVKHRNYSPDFHLSKVTEYNAMSEPKASLRERTEEASRSNTSRDALPDDAYLNGALNGPPIEFLEQELKRMHNCVLTSLLEATAWMGIPEAKRDTFIAGHMQNADFILNEALAEIKKARS